MQQLPYLEQTVHLNASIIITLRYVAAHKIHRATNSTMPPTWKRFHRRKQLKMIRIPGSRSRWSETICCMCPHDWINYLYRWVCECVL